MKFSKIEINTTLVAWIGALMYGIVLIIPDKDEITRRLRNGSTDCIVGHWIWEDSGNGNLIMAYRFHSDGTWNESDMLFNIPKSFSGTYTIQENEVVMTIRSSTTNLGIGEIRRGEINCSRKTLSFGNIVLKKD